VPRSKDNLNKQTLILEESLRSKGSAVTVVDIFLKQSLLSRHIYRFFNSEDKVHLTVNGTSMFAANIRDSIDSVLGLPRRLLHGAKSSRPQNSRYQDDANSYDMFSDGNRVNYFRGSFIGGGNLSTQIKYRPANSHQPNTIISLIAPGFVMSRI
jgi:hypothetical protein